MSYIDSFYVSKGCMLYIDRSIDIDRLFDAETLRVGVHLLHDVAAVLLHKPITVCACHSSHASKLLHVTAAGVYARLLRISFVATKLL